MLLHLQWERGNNMRYLPTGAQMKTGRPKDDHRDGYAVDGSDGAGGTFCCGDDGV